MLPFHFLLQKPLTFRFNFSAVGLNKSIISFRWWSSKTSNEITDKSHGIQKESDYKSLINHENLLEPARKFAIGLQGYMRREKFRRGHVKFIDVALKQMNQFQLEKDLLTYNRLIDIFPKDRFKPKTMFEAFWPKSHPQIELALRILQKMEENGVCPDYTTYKLLCEVFGKSSFPVQKCIRIAYWFQKFKDIDPYDLKENLPEDSTELCRLAMYRMLGNDAEIVDLKVKDMCMCNYI